MRVSILKLKRVHKFKYFKWVLSFFIVGIIVVVAVMSSINKNKPLCDKCNVILVSLDTLSALHLPCYGYERNTAPNLCAYADKNITFLNSYSQSPTTKDSHFSIFTSLYPHTHKMTGTFNGTLNESYQTLAQVLRLNGYKTIYNGQLFDIHFPLSQGMERGFNIFEGGNIDKWNDSYTRLLNNIEQKKPTFLFLHTYAVHTPYVTGHKEKHLFTTLPENPNIPLSQEEYENISPEFLSFVVKFVSMNNFSNNVKIEIADELKKAKSFKEAKEIYNNFPAKVKIFCFGYWYYSKINRNDTNQVEYLKALYDEQIYNLDKKLGNLFKLMDNPKLTKNTILIITADHGEEFMEHGNLSHSTDLFKTQTDVPLIIHIPGVHPRKITEIVQGIDIYPTALNLTGLKSRSLIEGIDLTGLIMGDKNAKRNKLLRSELYSLVALQMQNWRFYYDKQNKTPNELYNLTTDPQEKTNVANLYPKIVDEFRMSLN